MTAVKMDELYKEYVGQRNIKLNKEQFIYIVNLFPALLVVLSDGIVEDEEWGRVKKLAKILGQEFASDDFGVEKEENLSLLYKAEFKYLLKNREEWEVKFLNALKDYFVENDTSKEFVLETMYLFAEASEGISAEENDTIQSLCKELDINFGKTV
jgi:tellurite resistance protein